MNPDNTIRPWLLGCGQYFGANEAHPYRWPDPSTRPEVPYFTYRPINGSPDSKTAIQREHEQISGTHDAISKYQQHWTVKFQIDLYNSAEGFNNLMSCAASVAEQAYLNLFRDENAAFVGVDVVEDETEEDDHRIYYHQRMITTWHTWAVYEHKNINHVVDEVVLDNPFGVD